MTQSLRPSRPDSKAALNEGLAEWFGWFTSEPLSENLICLIDQLDAACPPPAPVEALP